MSSAASNIVPSQAGNAFSAINDKWVLKAGLAQNLKGGVIMDVINVEQAKIAEEAGACAGSPSCLS